MVKGFPSGRLLAVVASVFVSAGMFYAQDHAPAKKPPSANALVPGQGSAVAMPSVPVMAAAPGPNSAPLAPSPADSAPFVADARQAQLLAASAPVAAQDFRVELPAGKAPEAGLQIHTIWVARAISTMFLDIQTIGGQRQDPLPWHPNGLAIDVMIPNYHSPEGIDLGNQIAGFALANAKRWGVLHVIWRQGFYPGIGAPSWTADYGNETANHYDHVHIATDGGGYATGRETYFLDSMTTG